MKSHTLHVSETDFSGLSAEWSRPNRLNWSSVFVLPAWLETWWREIGSSGKPLLLSLKADGETMGIAPLVVEADRAAFMGSADVCDYQDLITAPGGEKDFSGALLDELAGRGVARLDLGAVRPDSVVMMALVPAAEEKGYSVRSQPEDVSAEMDLPSTWDGYLAGLEGKPRHELTRKLRNASAEGKLNYRVVSEPDRIIQTLDTFIEMFTGSRRDKAAFLTAGMETFFRSMAKAMAQTGIARLGILDLDGVPTAMILFFDYKDCFYLYNSGYDPRYESLSAGLLCKAMGIRTAIETGKKKFDFLKGNEPYKYRLGGKEVPLYRYHITLRAK